MTYIVLARKYRPKSFTEMVGQGHVVQALSNALQTQRLHHAYLFTGTRGVGKTTVSRILAKSLNCVGPDGQGGITDQPCGVCEACRQIDAGRFVDYTELDAASNRGVEEVQSLLEQAVYKPVQGRFKVFMIDEVHMLTNTAFNAMLKTLEEPPAYVKFVLATTDPQKVPVTVLSRCLQFNLRPMASDTVAQHLAQVLTAEGVPFDAPALEQLGLAARGSMRDALSLTDQAIAFGNGQVLQATVQGMLGSVDRQHIWRMVDAVAQRDGAAIVRAVNTLREQGLGAAQALDDMVHVLQRMAVVQLAPSEMAGQADAALLAAAQSLAPDVTQLLYSLCLSGRQELGWAPDEYAALTMVLLRVLAFVEPAEKKTLELTPRAQPEAAAPAPSAASLVQAPAPASLPSPTPTPVPPTVEVEEPDDVPWEDPIDEAASDMDMPFEALPMEQPAAPPVAEDDLPPWEDQPPALEQSVSAPMVIDTMAVQSPVHQDAVAASEQAITAGASASPLPIPSPSPTSSMPANVAIASGLATDPINPDAHPRWLDAVQALTDAQAVTALVRELALQSECVGWEGGHVQLRVASASLTGAGVIARLTQALQTAGLAERVSATVGPVAHNLAMRWEQAANARKHQLLADVQADPYVAGLMQAFDGKILPHTVVA